ncbi:MAG TPA: hypothetical protein VF192_00080, partial [Longimicrobiales bacterium]
MRAWLPGGRPISPLRVPGGAGGSTGRGRRGQRRDDDLTRCGTVRRPWPGVSIETPTEADAATAGQDRAPPDRRGFALLAVLWLIVVLGA